MFAALFNSRCVKGHIHILFADVLLALRGKVNGTAVCVCVCVCVCVSVTSVPDLGRERNERQAGLSDKLFQPLIGMSCGRVWRSFALCVLKCSADKWNPLIDGRASQADQ